MKHYDDNTEAPSDETQAPQEVPARKTRLAIAVVSDTDPRTVDQFFRGAVCKAGPAERIRTAIKALAAPHIT